MKSIVIMLMLVMFFTTITNLTTIKDLKKKVSNYKEIAIMWEETNDLCSATLEGAVANLIPLYAKGMESGIACMENEKDIEVCKQILADNLKKLNEIGK